jgi:hypothetical protein
LYKNLFSPKIKVKKKLPYSKNLGKEIFDYLENSKFKFNEKLIKRIFTNFSYKNDNLISKNNNL